MRFGGVCAWKTLGQFRMSKIRGSKPATRASWEFGEVPQAQIVVLAAGKNEGPAIRREQNAPRPFGLRIRGSSGAGRSPLPERKAANNALAAAYRDGKPDKPATLPLCRAPEPPVLRSSIDGFRFASGSSPLEHAAAADRLGRCE